MPSFTVLSGPHAGETVSFGRRTEAPLFRGVVLTRSTFSDDDAPFQVFKTRLRGDVSSGQGRDCILDGIQEKLGATFRFVTCDAVSLPLDGAISEQHAVVVDAGDGRFFVKDLGCESSVSLTQQNLHLALRSSPPSPFVGKSDESVALNGTLLDGRALERWQPLQTGARISCGDSELLWSGQLSPLRRKDGRGARRRTRAARARAGGVQAPKVCDRQEEPADDEGRGEAPPPLSPYLTRRKASFLSAMTGRKQAARRGNGLRGQGDLARPGAGRHQRGQAEDALLLRDRIGLEVQIAEKINRRARALDGIANPGVSDAAAAAATALADAASPIAAVASPFMLSALPGDKAGRDLVASPAAGEGIGANVQNGGERGGERGGEEAGDDSSSININRRRIREQQRRQQRKKLRKAAAGIFASPVRVPFRKTRVAVASAKKAGEECGNDEGGGVDEYGEREREREREREGEVSMGGLAMDLGEYIEEAAAEAGGTAGVGEKCAKGELSSIALPSPFFERGSVPAWAKAQNKKKEQEVREQRGNDVAQAPSRPLLLVLLLLVSMSWCLALFLDAVPSADFKGSVATVVVPSPLPSPLSLPSPSPRHHKTDSAGAVDPGGRDDVDDVDDDDDGGDIGDGSADGVKSDRIFTSVLGWGKLPKRQQEKEAAARSEASSSAKPETREVTKAETEAGANAEEATVVVARRAKAMRLRHSRGYPTPRPFHRKREVEKSSLPFTLFSTACNLAAAGFALAAAVVFAADNAPALPIYVF